MSFTDHLKDNQMKMAQHALFQTIFQEPNQTLGEIYDALEDDADNEFIFEMFRKLTVGQLVVAGASFADAEQKAQAAPAPVASAKPKPKADEDDEEEDEFDEEEDDVEFEDEEDDEEEDDDFDDEEEDEEDEEEDEEDDDENGDEDDEEEDEEEEAPKARKSKKKKSPKSSKKDGVEPVDLSTPEAQKTYQGSIVKCLKKNKARNKKTGMSAQNIRSEVLGTPKQVRDNLNLLIDEGRVAYGGQARGTRYWLE